jgi:hypothetical protein
LTPDIDLLAGRQAPRGAVEKVQDNDGLSPVEHFQKALSPRLKVAMDCPADEPP